MDVSRSTGRSALPAPQILKEVHGEVGFSANRASWNRPAIGGGWYSRVMMITREPHIMVRRIRDSPVLDDEGGDWTYTVVSGSRKHTGTCTNVSFGEVWRRVRRVMRRPEKFTWVQLTDDERRTYGLPVAQSERSKPPPPPGGYANGGIVSKEILARINETS